MKHNLTNLRKQTILTKLCAFLSVFFIAFSLNCGTQEGPTRLIAEPVDSVPEGAASGSDDPAGSVSNPADVVSGQTGNPQASANVLDPCADRDANTCLFDKTPAESGWRSIQKFGGAVDPVGTQLKTDFDGDGIENAKETSTNIWVADYPEMSTEIAPPITMEIKVFTTRGEETDTISNDITSDDIESRKNEGSEKFHQNESAVRTAQYEREVSEASSRSEERSDSSSSSYSASASFKGFGFEGSASFSTSRSNSSSRKNSSSESSSERTQVFEDRPFKNNIDRNATTVKSDSAAKKARKYRKEDKKKIKNGTMTKPNGGFVRASLFIRNHSINMPVRVSNILCSLLFETPQESFVLFRDFVSETTTIRFSR